MPVHLNFRYPTQIKLAIPQFRLGRAAREIRDRGTLAQRTAPAALPTSSSKSGRRFMSSLFGMRIPRYQDRGWRAPLRLKKPVKFTPPPSPGSRLAWGRGEGRSITNTRKQSTTQTLSRCSYFWAAPRSPRTSKGGS